MEKIYKTYTIFLKKKKKLLFLPIYKAILKLFLLGEESLLFRGFLDFYYFDVYLIIIQN